VSGVTEVRVTRSRDVLEGQILPVTGRLRRHGRLELLVVLPDGTSRLIPQAWTDDGGGGGGGGTGAAGAAGATLGSVSDLLAACVLVAALGVRAAGVREQAARKSPCKEDDRAACAAQSAAGTGSGTSPDGFRPASQPGGDHGDQAAGPADRQERRPGAGRARWNGGRR
jgi:hypothetical protein